MLPRHTARAYKPGPAPLPAPEAVRWKTLERERTAPAPPYLHACRHLTPHIYISRLIVMKAYARALPKRWHSQARVFTALGDEHRQRILLMFKRDEELTIKDI